MRRTLVPRLRFPEFRDAGEWSTEQLGNLATLIKEKAGSKSYTLMSVTAGVGLVTQIEKFGKEIAGEAYKNYYVIKKGDFAYNKSSTKQHPEGQMALLENIDHGAVPNSIFTCFRVNKEFVSPYFLKYPFATNIHGRWLRNFIAIGARANGALNVDSKDLLTLPIVFPSLKEQQKIADCLSSIDALISAQSQKVETLKTHKKGLMQQLFPCEDETIPRLRFPEFRDAGEWEEIALEKICTSISSGKDKSDSNGKYDLYGSTGVIGKTSNDAYDGSFILAARVGANAGLLTKASGKFGVTDNTLVIILKSSENIDFIFYSLEKFGLNKMVFGSGQPLITGGQLKEVGINLPSAEEQKKVTDCLFRLDALISAQSQKLSALKIHKQGLMQTLFPTADHDNGKAF